MMDHRVKAVGLFRGGRNSIDQTARPRIIDVKSPVHREVPADAIRSATR
jgi:hypothetical protein